MMLLTKVPAVLSAWREHEGYAKAKTLRKLVEKTDRKDFLSYVLRYNDERGITEDEIVANAVVLIVAGSESYRNSDERADLSPTEITTHLGEADPRDS
jgi:cytochrome P450